MPTGQGGSPIFLKAWFFHAERYYVTAVLVPTGRLHYFRIFISGICVGYDQVVMLQVSYGISWCSVVASMLPFSIMAAVLNFRMFTSGEQEVVSRHVLAVV